MLGLIFKITISKVCYVPIACGMFEYPRIHSLQIFPFSSNLFQILQNVSLSSETWESCAVHRRSGRVRLFVTPWTVARQAPLSMRFSRQEYWSGLTCPPPGMEKLVLLHILILKLRKCISNFK